MALLVTGDCPDCRHSWQLHPVATLVSICAECVYEEDYDLRAAEDMCGRIPPHFDASASQFVTAVERRRPLGRREVVLVDRAGATWRTIRGRSRSAATRRLMAEIEQKLAAMSMAEFWRSHMHELR